MSHENAPPIEPTSAEVHPDPFVVSITNNWVGVNGDLLTPTDGLEPLQRLLLEYRTDIEGAARQMQVQIQQQNPTAQVNLPSMVVMKLGNKPEKVLSENGLATNAQVMNRKDQIQEQFLPLWESAVMNGYIPEIRVMGSRQGVLVALLVKLPDQPAS